MIFVHWAYAQTCPDWIKKRENMPLCPVHGDPSILPETYPTGAVVVSSASFNGSEDVSREFTTSFVEQVVISAQDENTQMPLILLMGVPESTQAHIRNCINDLNIPDKAKEEALAALKPIDNMPWTWQQDYWEAFATSDGKIQFRQVKDYEKGISWKYLIPKIFPKPDISKIFSDKSIKDCRFRSGDLLPNSNLQSGHLGGNIEGLPGGFCLLGDDHFHGTQWESYADEFCGLPSNRIKVPTHWLTVGHTDEVMKVLKNNNPRPGQCDFSIAISSPRQAMRLLSQNTQSLFTSLRNRDHAILQKLCEDVLKAEDAERLPRRNDRPPRTRGTSGFIQHLLIPSSSAQILPLLDAYVERRARQRRIRERQRICNNNEKNLTNGDVLKLLQGDHPLAKYNEKVQEKMDDLKNLLARNIEYRLKCTPDFIQSPDLFYANNPDLVERRDENGVIHSSLPRKSGLSILPSSTNAVSIGNWQ